MTISTVKETINRIRSTRSDSPVVVMTTKKPGKLDVFFYKTVYGHDIVETKHPDLVGVFHRGMPDYQITTFIENAVR
jgi:azurin